MSNRIIFTHSYVTDWDVELLRRALNEEEVWTRQSNGILSRDQLWRRKGQNTWSIIAGNAIEYSDDMFFKGCLPPYRSNVFAFALYLNEDLDKKPEQKILVQHRKYGNVVNEEIVRSNFFPLDFNPLKNGLDRMMVDKIMSKSFPDTWKEWYEGESLI